MNNTEVSREQQKTETKAAYIAAVQELFALLALKADQKGPDHKEKVMAANNLCGKTRREMIAVWEGDDDYYGTSE